MVCVFWEGHRIWVLGVFFLVGENCKYLYYGQLIFIESLLSCLEFSLVVILNIVLRVGMSLMIAV